MPQCWPQFSRLFKNCSVILVGRRDVFSNKLLLRMYNTIWTWNNLTFPSFKTYLHDPLIAKSISFFLSCHSLDSQPFFTSISAFPSLPELTPDCLLRPPLHLQTPTPPLGMSLQFFQIPLFSGPVLGLIKALVAPHSQPLSGSSRSQFLCLFM